MIRFEMLLPLFYNDGRRIESEKFLRTDDDLVQRFGVTSADAVLIRGFSGPVSPDRSRPIRTLAFQLSLERFLSR